MCGSSARKLRRGKANLLGGRAYKELDYDLNFWRTKSGLEVDFVLGRGEVAVEVKGSSRIDGSDLKPIRAFLTEYRPARALFVCNEQRSRLHEGILITPWREFLEMLWNGAVVS
jgi:predicted AAA+ superfamily ATPase